MRRKILHLIPYDGIGGVEEAARSMDGLSEADLAFERRFLFPEVTTQARRRATHNPWRILRAGLRIAREGPDLLIVSLWRAAIAGCVARLLNRRIRLVLFIHNAADSHALDRIATRIALRVCDAVWADSRASLRQRFGAPPDKPVSVISFLVHRVPPLPAKPPAPVFAFWGRLAAQKHLARAIGIFARIHAARPGARFHIIGPDGGEAHLLRDLVRAQGLEDAVTFAGPMPFADIPAHVAEAAFYLQTSRHEGMAMSVMEAMQMGLVPVVTPVGEIARYCRDGENALIAGEDDAQTAEQVLRLLDDPARYEALRRAAIGTWAGATPYAQSVLSAARAALAGERAGKGL